MVVETGGTDCGAVDFTFPDTAEDDFLGAGSTTDGEVEHTCPHSVFPHTRQVGAFMLLV
jgi:hypothetical protein